MAASKQNFMLEPPSFISPISLLIVVAPYYKKIADELVAGARSEIEQAGGSSELVEVPGALEIPTTIAIASRQLDFDGYVALGCIIRGETTHYDTVCNDSSRALQLLGLQGVCIGNGILTVDNTRQAQDRADASRQNKGGGAALAALHLIALSQKWEQSKGKVGFLSSDETSEA